MFLCIIAENPFFFNGCISRRQNRSRSSSVSETYRICVSRRIQLTVLLLAAVSVPALLAETFCLQHDFSGRERDVFRQLLSGRTNGEIAEALFITENTVKYHVRNLLQKTGCKNRTELQRQYTAALYPDMDTDKIRPFSAG